MKLFGKRNKVSGIKWTCIPGMIGTSEIIILETKKLNKELKRNKMNRYLRAQVQPLPCGMAQMLIFRGAN